MIFRNTFFFILLFFTGLVRAVDDSDLRSFVLGGSTQSPQDRSYIVPSPTHKFPNGHCKVIPSVSNNIQSLEVRFYTHYPTSNSIDVGFTGGRLYPDGVFEYGLIRVDEDFRNGGIAGRLNEPLFRELVSKANAAETHWADTNEAEFLKGLQSGKSTMDAAKGTPSSKLWGKEGWMIKKVHYEPGQMPAVEYIRDYPKGILDGAKRPDHGIDLSKCSGSTVVKGNVLSNCKCVIKPLRAPIRFVRPAVGAAGNVAGPMVATMIAETVGTNIEFATMDENREGLMTRCFGSGPGDMVKRWTGWDGVDRLEHPDRYKARDAYREKIKQEADLEYERNSGFGAYAP